MIAHALISVAFFVNELLVEKEIYQQWNLNETRNLRQISANEPACLVLANLLIRGTNLHVSDEK